MIPETTPPAICAVAVTDADVAGHFSIRHEVFVVEQRIFSATDRDQIDDRPDTIHLVGKAGPHVVGSVRLYPLDEAGLIWQGDRLAVSPTHRVFQLGSDLVRMAVATAAVNAGHVMHAHIQLPNVRFFQRLGWEIAGAVDLYHGVSHQPMAIDLTQVAHLSQTDDCLVGESAR